MKQDWDDAELAIEQLHEKLGDAVFFGEGQNEIMMLRHDQLSHLWWRLSAGQVAKLQSFRIQKPQQVAPISWLPPRSIVATPVDVGISFAEGDNLQTAHQVVVVRAIAELSAQRQKILAALMSGKAETRDSCELSDFVLERRSRTIGENHWTWWTPVAMTSIESVLNSAVGFQSSKTFSPLLASPVLTAPLPVLEFGSWEAVEGHPEAKPKLGHKVFRFPDFTTKAGHEYQYRLKFKWWFQRMGQPERGMPLQATEVETPFSNPTEIVRIVDGPDVNSQ